jgi:hypothetical protein
MATLHEAWTFLLAADLQLEHGNFCWDIYQSKSKIKLLVITIGNYLMLLVSY